jgi:hypothetical protein
VSFSFSALDQKRRDLVRDADGVVRIVWCSFEEKVCRGVIVPQKMMCCADVRN